MNGEATQLDAQQAMRDFWEAEACGERYAQGRDLIDRLNVQARRKYELEPYIPAFARFADGTGKKVLEIGVGMGADHAQWASARPSYLAGIDITDRAIELTRMRLGAVGLSSDLRVADAEDLPFEDDTFDVVYSWGVLHHSSEPAAAVREIRRVLKVGGEARIMLYHKYGYVFRLMWIRYALLAGDPMRSLDDIISEYNESPGTKAYTPDSAKRLFARFSTFTCDTILTHADFLEGDVGNRHRGLPLRVLKALWPRALIRRSNPRHGSDLLITATK